MKLTIQNNSEKNIVITFGRGESHRIEGFEQYIYESDVSNGRINIMIQNNYESYMKDDKYYFFINARTECSTGLNKEGIIYINRKKCHYQNTVWYEFFSISTNGCKFENLTHIVTNSDEMINVYNQRKKSKKSRMGYQMLINFFDTLYLGGLMGVILWIVFEYKVMVLFLLGLYLFITVINLCLSKLHRSKIRIFNWAKDNFDEDDIPYFIKRINFFCK